VRLVVGVPSAPHGARPNPILGHTGRVVGRSHPSRRRAFSCLESRSCQCRERLSRLAARVLPRGTRENGFCRNLRNEAQFDCDDRVRMLAPRRDSAQRARGLACEDARASAAHLHAAHGTKMIREIRR
jgi:hypothetical protein